MYMKLQYSMLAVRRTNCKIHAQRLEELPRLDFLFLLGKAAIYTQRYFSFMTVLHSYFKLGLMPYSTDM